MFESRIALRWGTSPPRMPPIRPAQTTSASIADTASPTSLNDAHLGIFAVQDLAGAPGRAGSMSVAEELQVHGTALRADSGLLVTFLVAP